jgi:hypothetical protein
MDEFNFTESANEIFGDESAAESTNEASTEGQSQEVGNPDTTEQQAEVSPKDMLEKVLEEKNPEVDPELLTKINTLGAIHNGMPIKVDSPEHLKEILQKGYDYTKKTMAHAEEVRAKTEEFQKKEAQFQEREAQYVQKENELAETKAENQIMEGLLLDWKQNDPELFQYISAAFQKAVSGYQAQQPLLKQYDNRFKELNDKIAAFENDGKVKELSGIKDSWEKELADVQTTKAQGLTKLGVKVDWDKVKEAWSADSSNKLSVEDALYASHGKEIKAAYESHQKLLATKLKAQSGMLARGGASGGAGKQPETVKHRIGDYESIMKDAAAQF